MGSHFHHTGPGETSPKGTRGSVWNWARRYDLLLGLVTLGREQAFRQSIANLAHLQPGERVLDVGCGTGTLAMEALRRVGETGQVSGIDPSWQMIARACSKAERVGLSINFQVGVIEQLAFPDQAFDRVLSTFMMHHLPDDLKRQGLAEIVRVLKPGGHLLVLDLKGHAGPWKSSMRDQPALIKEVGFSHVEMGQTRLFDFVRARKSEDVERGDQSASCLP